MYSGKLFYGEYKERVIERDNPSPKALIGMWRQLCWFMGEEEDRSKRVEQYGLSVQNIMDAGCYRHMMSSGIGESLLNCFTSLRSSLRDNPIVEDRSRQISHESLFIFCPREANRAWKALCNQAQSTHPTLEHVKLLVAYLRRTKVRAKYVAVLERWLCYLEAAQ